jgi:hypothetical protein
MKDVFARPAVMMSAPVTAEGKRIARPTRAKTTTESANSAQGMETGSSSAEVRWIP